MLKETVEERNTRRKAEAELSGLEEVTNLQQRLLGEIESVTSKNPSFEDFSESERCLANVVSALMIEHSKPQTWECESALKRLGQAFVLAQREADIPVQALANTARWAANNLTLARKKEQDRLIDRISKDVEEGGKAKLRKEEMARFKDLRKSMGESAQRAIFEAKISPTPEGFKSLQDSLVWLAARIISANREVGASPEIEAITARLYTWRLVEKLGATLSTP